MATKAQIEANRQNAQPQNHRLTQAQRNTHRSSSNTNLPNKANLARDTAIRSAKQTQSKSPPGHRGLREQVRMLRPAESVLRTPSAKSLNLRESAVQTLAQKLDSIAHYWYPMLAEALRSRQIEIQRVGGGVE